MATTTTSYKNLTWYNIVAETDAELNEAIIELREKFNFHELALEDCLSTNQRPKIDEYDGILFLVLHFPKFNKNTRRIETREMDVFLGKNFVVTLHDGDLKPTQKIQSLVADSEVEKKFYLGKGSGYLLYELMSHAFDYCFPIADKISSNISDLEQDILNDEGDVVHDHLKEILLVKRNIIRFRRIMLPMRSVVVGLENMKNRSLPDRLDVYFDDILDQIERLWDLLTSYKELIEALQDTNESIISSRTNNVVKLLTVFSVILLPLNLVASIYGMNVALPYNHHPMAFVGISLGMIGIAFIMLLFFKLRKWL